MRIKAEKSISNLPIEDGKEECVCVCVCVCVSIHLAFNENNLPRLLRKRKSLFFLKVLRTIVLSSWP